MGMNRNQNRAEIGLLVAAEIGLLVATAAHPRAKMMEDATTANFIGTKL
jgi:hypothetical protein